MAPLCAVDAVLTDAALLPYYLVLSVAVRIASA